MKRFLSSVFISCALLLASAFSFNAVADTSLVYSEPDYAVSVFADDTTKADAVVAVADKATDAADIDSGNSNFLIPVMFTYFETDPVFSAKLCFYCYVDAVDGVSTKIPIG